MFDITWRRRPESNRGPRICNHRKNPYFIITYTYLFSEIGIVSRCSVVFEKPIFGVILKVYPVSWSTESFDSPSPAEGAQRQTLVRAELLTRLAALFKTNHQLAPSLFASANPRPLNSAVTESRNLIR